MKTEEARAILRNMGFTVVDGSLSAFGTKTSTIGVVIDEEHRCHEAMSTYSFRKMVEEELEGNR